ncbi:MAG: hypothetical protein KJO08_01415 [Gammaproteobacteria bacterium]|nr:hypothetical protein [Gammaproteobacteria bacterium]
MDKNFSFANITPLGSGIRQADHDADFAVVSYLGGIYLAEITHEHDQSVDSRRVFAYSLEQERWITVYTGQLTGEWDRTLSTPGVRSEIRIITASETGPDVMLIRFTSCLGVELLRSEDGKHFTVESGEPSENTPEKIIGSDQDSLVGRVNTEVNHYFVFRQLLVHRDHLFGVPAEGTEIAPNLLLHCPYGRGEAAWVQACLPGFGQQDNRAVSTLISFGGVLYAAAANAARGFEIWRQKDTDASDPNTSDPREMWEPVLIRGAYGYAHNTEVLSMVVHKDALYIVAEADFSRQATAARYGEDPGFEVIRLHRSGRWELLIGTLRTSPQGLQVPLSGLGPGLDRLDKMMPLSFAANDQALFLATWNKAGFQLWMSEDGEEWATIRQPDFAGFYQIESCQALSVGKAIVLAFDIENLDGTRERQLWVGK